MFLPLRRLQKKLWSIEHLCTRRLHCAVNLSAGIWKISTELAQLPLTLASNHKVLGEPPVLHKVHEEALATCPQGLCHTGR